MSEDIFPCRGPCQLSARWALLFGLLARGVRRKGPTRSDRGPRQSPVRDRKVTQVLFTRKRAVGQIAVDVQ